MEYVLMGLPVVLGIGVVWKRVSKALILIKEVSDVLVKVSESLEDKTLTKEEIDGIKKEALEVAAAAKALVS